MNLLSIIPGLQLYVLQLAPLGPCLGPYQWRSQDSLWKYPWESHGLLLLLRLYAHMFWRCSCLLANRYVFCYMTYLCSFSSWIVWVAPCLWDLSTCSTLIHLNLSVYLNFAFPVSYAAEYAVHGDDRISDSKLS